MAATAHSCVKDPLRKCSKVANHFALLVDLGGVDEIFTPVPSGSQMEQPSLHQFKNEKSQTKEIRKLEMDIRGKQNTVILPFTARGSP